LFHNLYAMLAGYAVEIVQNLHLVVDLVSSDVVAADSPTKFIEIIDERIHQALLIPMLS
jgi:hypothetical protein